MVTITLNTVIICNTWNKNIENKKRELDILEFDKLNKESFNATMGLVDEIITDAFTRYTIMDQDIREAIYINDEMIHNMMFNVLKDVYTSISPQILDKLSTIYNSDYVDDVLAKKVQMLTMGYVIENNGTYRNF